MSSSIDPRYLLIGLPSHRATFVHRCFNVVALSKGTLGNSSMRYAYCVSCNFRFFECQVMKSNCFSSCFVINLLSWSILDFFCFVVDPGDSAWVYHSHHNQIRPAAFWSLAAKAPFHSFFLEFCWNKGGTTLFHFQEQPESHDGQPESG